MLRSELVGHGQNFLPSKKSFGTFYLNAVVRYFIIKRTRFTNKKKRKTKKIFEIYLKANYQL